MVTRVKEHGSKVTVTTRRRISMPFGLKPHELVAAVSVLIFLVLTLIFYYWTLKPKQEEVSSLQRQLDQLTKAEIDATAIAGKGAQPVIDQAKHALESLSYFKSMHLKPLSVGRISLINEINAMAKRNGVVLTSGIDMKTDRSGVEVEDDKNIAKRKSKESFLRVFPNLDMRFTVAGEYKSLRQFISDLEANKQFKTIESVNLNIIKDTEGTRSNRRMVITGISLTIDMTAYFYPESN